MEIRSPFLFGEPVWVVHYVPVRVVHMGCGVIGPVSLVVRVAIVVIVAIEVAIVALVGLGLGIGLPSCLVRTVCRDEVIVSTPAPGPASCGDRGIRGVCRRGIGERWWNGGGNWWDRGGRWWNGGDRWWDRGGP